MHAPSADCQICPRLAAFRGEQRAAYPDWFNRPVPSFGPEEAAVLVVGLAPGLRGANRTGRPFTGDFAGDLLYATLLATGFATGEYKADPDDGLTLVNCRITNAVRCLPPQNKPVGAEIANCRPFLAGELQGVQGLQVVVALGRIAHDSLLRTLGVRLASYPFAHGALHEVGGLVVADSYHCSRYNTQTGRLTEAMFRSVFEQVKVLVDR
jgi:uracil-DNA glycosylase family 4